MSSQNTKPGAAEGEGQAQQEAETLKCRGHSLLCNHSQSCSQELHPALTGDDRKNYSPQCFPPRLRVRHE